MAITHTILDSIPSIFLGAPDSDQVLSALPGHVLLQQGKGYEAVKLTVIGSLLSLIFSCLFIPLLILAAPFFEEYTKNYMGWILIGVVVFMLLREKGFQDKLWSLFVFLLAGVLGLVVLNMPKLQQPLLPMLSGLFGISMLIVSLTQKTNVPEQSISETIEVGGWDTSKAVGAAVVSGSVVGFLPGVGPAQAAILGNELVGNLKTYAFMILVGGINTVNMQISLVTLYVLGKARNGAVLAVRNMIGQIGLNELIVFIASGLLAAGIAVFLALNIAKVFSKLISKVNYRLLCLSVIFIVTSLVFYFSSFLGLFVLAISTAVGIIPNIKEVKRSHLMGCLLLPVILFFIL